MTEVRAVMESDIKKQAEDILSSLGIPASSAITMFYKQIILHGGLPFDAKLSSPIPDRLCPRTKEELDAALQLGYDDMLAGRTKPVNEVFDALRRDYGI